jgi:hypothetical protein
MKVCHERALAALLGGEQAPGATGRLECSGVQRLPAEPVGEPGDPGGKVRVHEIVVGDRHLSAQEHPRRIPLQQHLAARDEADPRAVLVGRARAGRRGPHGPVDVDAGPPARCLSEE